MPVRFATPIAHQTSANYGAFANAVALGRPFRQPYTAALAINPNNYARGLELFLASAGDVSRLYAWLDGTVTFVAGTAAAPGDRLVLSTLPTVLGTGASSLAGLAMLERPPKRLTFVNVDRAAVQTALETLLTTAHATATGAATTWHPCMRQRVTDGTNPSVSLKAYLDAHPPVATTVTTLVTDMLNPPAAGAPLLAEVVSKAGDALGRAAAYLATDPLPAAAPFPLGAATDPGRARRVTIVSEDSAENPLDPLYYLHLFMRRMFVTPAANRVVVTLTNTVVGTNLVHPLVTLLPALNNPTVPVARPPQIAGAQRFWTGKLVNWHGYPFPPAARVSQAEWHYTAAGLFEARAASTGAAIPVTITNPHRTKADAFWTTYANITNTICTRLQIPAELVTALACNESLANLSPRSIRLERLLDTNRTALRSSPSAALELRYDQVVGTEVTVTGVTRQAGDRSVVHVTLAAPRAIAANRFSNIRPALRLLVGNADRLVIAGNSAGTATATTYDITVVDGVFSGGSAAAGTQPPATTSYYSASRRGAGNAAAGPVETVLGRAGVLRRLRFQAANTLPAGTVVTVMRNGAASALTATLGAAPATNANDLTNEVAVASGDRIALRVVTPAAAAPAQLRNIRCTVQFAPADSGTAYVLEGYSPPGGVPSPYNGAAAVRPGRAMTWSELATVMDVLGGDRVSPGLLQTLISTARGVIQYLNRLDPGSYGAVGATPAPATSGGFIEWLCVPAHSILLGAAYMRQLFRSRDTRFDLPVTGSAYNRGNLSTTPNRRWGFGDATWVYPDHIAPYFNAAVQLFDGASPPAVAPAVRFLS